MNIQKVSNRKCRGFVVDRTPFKGSNLFGEWLGDKYAVFSYGYHFPMYVCDGKTWYSNGDRYSVTTSRHKSQSHPYQECQEVDTKFLKKLLNLS